MGRDTGSTGAPTSSALASCSTSSSPGGDRFVARSRTELLDLIATAEARPPRQIDDAIPKELERICLQGARQAGVRAVSDGRRHGRRVAALPRLDRSSVGPTLTWPPLSPTPGPIRDALPPRRSGSSDSDQQPIKIVPKGLRSFDEHDADFFLELLPGPRDRDGLPESLRFWKTRIETTDADKTFRVGLIYGPSGCGKSSLVKAGLLPRLAKHVLPVYIEATPEETESRLLRALRKACPDLPPGLDLVDSLAAIRRGRVLRSGQKVLLILDQFEQWLHARRGEENTELVAALRHCDGEHVQAVVMVRDDFWMAATRFMDELEIELLKGQNTAAVDLFDPRHARKVLTAFGQRLRNRAGADDATSPRISTPSWIKRSANLPRTARSSRCASLCSPRWSRENPGPRQPCERSAALRAWASRFWKRPSLLTGQPEAPPPPEGGPGRSESPAAGNRHGHQGTDAVATRTSERHRVMPTALGISTDLLRILDNELRLITPTDPEGSGDERLPARRVGDTTN